MDVSGCLHLSFAVFLFGVWGIAAVRSHVISILIAVELMLFSCSFNFVVFSVYLDDLFGQVFSLLVLTVAAAESAIGLAILVSYFRVRGTIVVDYVSLLKG